MTITQERALPEWQGTENGLILISDFFANQYDSIVAGLNQAEIPYELKFNPFDIPQRRWKEGTFRIYVPVMYIIIALDLCWSIEHGSSD